MRFVKITLTLALLCTAIFAQQKDYKNASTNMEGDENDSDCSQSSGFTVDKPASVDDANICFMVVTCDDDGSMEYCGNDLGPHLEFFMQQRTGSIEILNSSNGNCRIDGEWLVCYDGIKVDTNEARARIERDKIKVPGGGTYSIVARVKTGTPIPFGGVIILEQFTILDTDPIRPPQISSANSVLAIRNAIHLQVQNSARLDIYNIKGKLEKTLHFNSGVYSVSLGDLPKGMYIAKASFGSEKRILRLPIR